MQPGPAVPWAGQSPYGDDKAIPYIGSPFAYTSDEPTPTVRIMANRVEYNCKMEDEELAFDHTGLLPRVTKA